MFKHDNEKERILCAAIWYTNAPISEEANTVLRKRGYSPYNTDKGLVLCGWRHANIIYQAASVFPKGYCPKMKDAIQGFLTSKNRFLDRKEAHTLFSEENVAEYEDELYSEDLY